MYERKILNLDLLGLHITACCELADIIRDWEPYLLFTSQSSEMLWLPSLSCCLLVREGYKFYTELLYAILTRRYQFLVSWWYTSVINRGVFGKNFPVGAYAQEDTEETTHLRRQEEADAEEDSKRWRIEEEDFYFLTRYTVGPSISC